MRVLAISAAFLGLSTGAISATPLIASGPVLTSDPLVTVIHHKPWHKGGPPWARPGRGRDRGDDFEGRRGRPRPVTGCITGFQELFDRYRGVYVRRPVQVCRGGRGQDYGFGER